MQKAILTILATATLTACASATPPSITATDVASAQTEQARISGLAAASLDQLPAAQATFAGALGGDVTIDGDGGYAILGDIALTADFSGDAAITGTVDNINLIEDGIPTQLLGGALTVAGTTDDTAFTAKATGTLDAVGDDFPFRGSAAIALDLDGDYRIDTSPISGKTSLLGTWTGGSTDGDFEVQGSGDVYATEQ